MAKFVTRFGEKVAPKARDYGVSRTKQSFKAECDINTLMRKYLKSGVMPVGIGVGQYGDFYEAGDFMEAQLVIKRAGSQFAALPANVRERFKNDPARLLQFVGDARNLEEARKLGLLKDVPNPPGVAENKTDAVKKEG